MLGVKLCANYSNTKRINGEIMVEQVKKKMDAWKTGRFMPLVSRTWSVNSLVFSKLWFKTASIDLRVGDISKMTSEVKSWIYQPHLTKPQESLLYRDIKEGGLGLFNIAARAKANILVSFCQSAFGHKCSINMFHHDIFRIHVLQDKVKNPGCHQRDSSSRERGSRSRGDEGKGLVSEVSKERNHSSPR